MSAERTIRVDWKLFALLPVVLGACSWFTDFKRTPVVYPWESVNDSVPPRANPQFSVPVQGALAPALAVSYRAMPDSFAQLANPVPADSRSVENGRKLYQINCAVCHGLAGDGKGTILKYGGMFPPAVNGAGTQARSDGYIWGIIRNGRVAMPSYNRIEEHERWDVVNYVRALATRTADTTLVGLPGETGDRLPSATEMAPTRPAPYYKHFGMQAGAPRISATAPANVPAPTAIGDSASVTTRPDSTRNRGQQP